MKRSTSLLLTCAMGITLLAGCGNNAQTAETTTAAASGNVQQTTTTSAKPETEAPAPAETTAAATEAENVTANGDKTVTIAQSASFSMGFGQGVMVYAKALIAGLYQYDDSAKIQEIYTKALNSANESSVIIPLNYRNEYAVFNSDKIASYTFNSIPNHVDVAAIKLK